MPAPNASAPIKALVIIEVGISPASVRKLAIGVAIPTATPTVISGRKATTRER
ncbi:Uncharacterised protein [Mycobacteroides abscessus subsp. abscessus]|nr:Uncharacterised protein [Mycobacteroides abscessus subsp. abscessus]SKY27354.1 Uncharacterised protein [Mycobacteroides abscessus subsp. abscessus]